MPDAGKRTLLISRGWIQAAIIVFLFGFLVLGLLAYRTYTGEPPIPGRVVGPKGSVLFTRADIDSVAMVSNKALSSRASRTARTESNSARRQ
jgi:nitric oxide reductase subunit B